MKDIGGIGVYIKPTLSVASALNISAEYCCNKLSSKLALSFSSPTNTGERFNAFVFVGGTRPKNKILKLIIFYVLQSKIS